MKRGGQRSIKAAEAITEGMFLLFEVQDAGIGLSEEGRRNLFKPFKQAQRLAGGTGLGLFSLAKRLDALGGYYGVRARPDGGQGSLFWFAFPYRPDEESAAAAAVAAMSDEKYGIVPRTLRMTGETYAPRFAGLNTAASPRGATAEVLATRRDSVGLVPVQNSGSSEQKPMRILLVDDSLSIVKMTAMMLRKHKHEVVVAENGLEAFELMKAEYKHMQELESNSAAEVVGDGGEARMPLAPFDVLLMDLQMPVMDGLESTRRIRLFENEISNRKPFDQEGVGHSELVQALGQSYYQFIVGVSANSDEQTVSQSYNAGFDAFIGKPFQVETLYSVLEESGQKERA